MDVKELLAKASLASLEQKLDFDTWMRAAWTAYMDARPGYREALEEQQLRGQLEALRTAGRIGRA